MRSTDDTLAAARHDFKCEFGCKCFICGGDWGVSSYFPRVLDVHEIVGGSLRCRTKLDRRFWLLLCRKHHEEFQVRGAVPYTMQFALKKIADPKWYDLQGSLSVCGWGSRFITEEQVDSFVGRLRDRRREYGAEVLWRTS